MWYLHQMFCIEHTVIRFFMRCLNIFVYKVFLRVYFLKLIKKMEKAFPNTKKNHLSLKILIKWKMWKSKDINKNEKIINVMCFDVYKRFISAALFKVINFLSELWFSSGYIFNFFSLKYRFNVYHFFLRLCPIYLLHKPTYIDI